jgi:hypothetical protein
VIPMLKQFGSGERVVAFEKRLSSAQIACLLHDHLVIVLVDKRKLVCQQCPRFSLPAFIEKLITPQSYEGHYVVLYHHYTDEAGSSVFLFVDPDRTTAPCYVQAKVLDEV